MSKISVHLNVLIVDSYLSGYKFKGGNNMDKNFSNGFMQDIADLLEVCMKNKTDNVDLDFEINRIHLGVNITFSIRKPNQTDI